MAYVQKFDGNYDKIYSVKYLNTRTKYPFLDLILRNIEEDIIITCKVNTEKHGEKEFNEHKKSADTLTTEIRRLEEENITYITKICYLECDFKRLNIVEIDGKCV